MRVILDHVNGRSYTDNLDLEFETIDKLKRWVDSERPDWTSYQVLVVRKVETSTAK